MINVIASIHIKEGQVAAFLDIFKSNIPNVLQEQGCMEYIPTVDVPTGLAPQELDGNVVTILEKWGSVENLKAHLVSPHMRAYQAKVKDLVEKVTVKVLAEARSHESLLQINSNKNLVCSDAKFA
jgi:quinol monooxygenase YgiN